MFMCQKWACIKAALQETHARMLSVQEVRIENGLVIIVSQFLCRLLLVATQKCYWHDEEFKPKHLSAWWSSMRRQTLVKW